MAEGAGGGQREECQHGYTHRWSTILTWPLPTQGLYHCPIKSIFNPHLGIKLEVSIGLVDPSPGLLSDGVLSVPCLLKSRHFPPALPLSPLQLLLRGFDPLQSFRGTLKSVDICCFLSHLRYSLSSCCTILHHKACCHCQSFSSPRRRVSLINWQIQAFSEKIFSSN